MLGDHGKVNKLCLHENKSKKYIIRKDKERENICQFLNEFSPISPSEKENACFYRVISFSTKANRRT